jgi:hypothetical protein
MSIFSEYRAEQRRVETLMRELLSADDETFIERVGDMMLKSDRALHYDEFLDFLQNQSLLRILKRVVHRKL